MNEDIKNRALEWAKTNRGVSARTIFNFFMAKDYGQPVAPVNENGYPHDHGDFGRCLKLLEAVPEWLPRLGELEALGGLDGQIWAAIAPHAEAWKARMESSTQGKEWVDKDLRAIVKPLEEASGEWARVGPNARIRARKTDSPIVQAIVAKAQGASDEEVYQLVEKAQFANATDEQLLQAARYIVAKENKASASFIQRRMGLGYSKAAALIQALEEEGSVTAAAAHGKRQVAEKLLKAYGITEKIDKIAKETGTSPEHVLETGKRIIGMGHNSGEEDLTEDVGGVAGKRLKSLVDRIERLEEEKSGLAEDIKEIYGEAKATGFDAPTIRKIIKLRKMDVEKRRKSDELLDLYKSAIGME